MKKQLLDKSIILAVHFKSGDFKNYPLELERCCCYGVAEKNVAEYEVEDSAPFWKTKQYKMLPFTKTIKYIEFEDSREVDAIKIVADEIRSLSVSIELYPCENATLSDVLKKLPVEQAIAYLKDNEIPIKL